MKIDNIEKVFEEALKITDIGERMLFWHNFKRSFDTLPASAQEAYRVASKAKAKELLAETYALLGKEMPASPTGS